MLEKLWTCSLSRYKLLIEVKNWCTYKWIIWVSFIFYNHNLDFVVCSVWKIMSFKYGWHLIRHRFLLQKTGLKLSDIHIIGHSLGAHIAGYAGQRVPGIARISGNQCCLFFFKFLFPTFIFNSCGFIIEFQNLCYLVLNSQDVQKFSSGTP